MVAIFFVSIYSYDNNLNKKHRNGKIKNNLGKD